MSHNIYELFATKFGDNRDDPFLTLPGGESYTYGQIDRRSAAMAAVLADGGAQPGDRVVVQVDKSVDAVALYFACLRAGFVYVPLNTAYTPDEIGFFLGDAEPAVFVYPPDLAGKLKPMADIANVKRTFTLSHDGGGTLADIASQVTALGGVVERDANDVAAMLYTSGTTGRPKGAMLTHAGLAANALALHHIWRFRLGDVLLHTLPIFHVHGLFVALHCAILNASEVIFCHRFDVETVRRHLRDATVYMGVPTHYVRLLNDPDFGPHDCQTIRMFTSGSAPMTEVVFNQFTERTGHVICERYGMTECGIITSNPPEGQRVAGTVGYALPDMELRVVDQADRPVDDGDVGMVQVRGPHLFKGYWLLPDKTDESFTDDGFFRTGDIGWLTGDGRLALAGRGSDMIISGGYNVYPKEIELQLDETPGVVESAVVGLPHDDFGEAVTAFVVAESHINDDVLQAALADKLAKFKQPKRYIYLDALPRNTMGKVQKGELRRSYDELYRPSPT
ncbi:MAG: AMP-binding protein [Acidimicrobiia bacterium]|nr:AMP-binding protein [Acidimicrobiia bacterium]